MTMSDIAPPTANKYDRLHELIDKTAKNRFLASSRMIAHKNWSSWTVSAMTICVLGLSLLQAMDIGNAAADKGTTYAIALFSIFILAYSLTMTMSEFSLRAFKYHQCGLDLMKLRGKVFSEKMDAKQKDDLYSELNAEYGNILDQHENHAPIDYYRMQLSSQTMKKYYEIRWWNHACINIRYFLGFWHYLLLILLSLGCLSYVSWRYIF